MAAPTTPVAPTVAGLNPLELTVTYITPSATPPVTGRQMELREAGITTWRRVDSGESPTNVFRVRNRDGWSEWSSPGSGSTTAELYYYARQNDPPSYSNIEEIFPHPLPHSKLDDSHTETSYGSPYSSVFRQRTLIALAQGESYPEHFEHYVRKDQTTGSDPRRTYGKLADWKHVDHKSPAKRDADVKLSWKEHQRIHLSNEEHDRVDGWVWSEPFQKMMIELVHEDTVRGKVHAAIDAKGDGEPISEAQIDKMIADAQVLTAPTIVSITVTGTGGVREVTIRGKATAGAHVQCGGQNAPERTEKSPWTKVSHTGDYEIGGLDASALLQGTRTKSQFFVDQWPGNLRIWTTTDQEVAL